MSRAGRGVPVCSALGGTRASGDVLTSNLNYKTLSSLSGVKANDDVSVIRVRTYNQIRGSYRRRVLNFLSFAAMALARVPWIDHVDLVYASSTPLTTGLVGYLVGAMKRRPFYFEGATCGPNQPSLRARSRRTDGTPHRVVQRLFYRKAVKVIALTEGIRAGVIAKGKDPADVLFVPNGMDDWMLDVRPAVPSDTRSIPETTSSVPILGRTAVGTRSKRSSKPRSSWQGLECASC